MTRYIVTAVMYLIIGTLLIVICEFIHKILMLLGA